MSSQPRKFDVQPVKPSAAIEREAARWLALQEDRTLTPAERQAFDAWRQADSRHAAAVAELENAWQTFDQLAHYPRPDKDDADPDFFARPRRFRRHAWTIAWAAAASVALAFVLWPRWGKTTALAPATTVASSVRQLSDGTEVELKTGSQIEEQFTPGERRVRLTRGEAHFAVTKNPLRPFVVEANGIAVRAVGTAFAVRMDRDAIKVLVTEGRVRVATPPPIAAPTPALVSTSLPASAPELVAGQRITVSTAMSAQDPLRPAVIETLSPVAIDQELAWQSSRLVFDATPLAEAIERFNRHPTSAARCRLVLADARLGTLRISGRFRADNADSFAELLQTSFGFVTEHRGDTIVLRSAP
ncbi:MAG: FecR domain-containing protein [Opitutae bacterium]|nr:FecR domain-containing protein [Opitutae bacterium]